MTIMIAELYDALKDAGVDDEKARKAAESVAAYDNRLTRLTTLTQAALAVLILLLGSQAGLWMEVGKLNGTTTRIDSQLTQISSKIDLIGK